MNDHEDPRGTDEERLLFRSMRRRREARVSPLPLLGALVLVAGVGLAVWLWLRPGSAPDPLPFADSPVQATNLTQARTTPAATGLNAPDLDASDIVVRDLLRTLSAHPRWAAWLVPDNLVRRFVTAVVNVAEGGSPTPYLRVMAPEGSFQVRESGGELVIDSASYHRYDLLTEAFASLDTQASARLYHALHPLFEEAHRELGLSRTFETSLALAFGQLLAVEAPAEPVAVVADKEIYDFVDPELESLSKPQKHILRLGPGNALRVQAKMRELSYAIGVVPRLPP